MQLEVIRNAVVIPEETVQIEQGGSYVMVVMPDNTVERRFIVLGKRRGGQVVVSSGLEAGERLVVEGFHTIRHDDVVIPITVEEHQKRIQGQQPPAGAVAEG
jgi:membrane fusion protein (multidrug efflux system)